MVADPSTNARKRVVFFKEVDRLAVFAGGNQSDVPLNAHVRRAGRPARSGASFCDGIAARDGLGVLFVSGPPFRKTFVVFARYFDRADFGALTAAGALVQIDEAGLLAYASFELPRFPVEPKKFGVCQKLDVQMPADLDQFG
jgi:hypothetical protein